MPKQAATPTVVAAAATHQAGRPGCRRRGSCLGCGGVGMLARRGSVGACSAATAANAASSFRSSNSKRRYRSGCWPGGWLGCWPWPLAAAARRRTRRLPIAPAGLDPGAAVGAVGCGAANAAGAVSPAAGGGSRRNAGPRISSMSGGGAGSRPAAIGVVGGCRPSGTELAMATSPVPHRGHDTAPWEIRRQAGQTPWCSEGPAPVSALAPGAVTAPVSSTGIDSTALGGSLRPRPQCCPSGGVMLCARWRGSGGAVASTVGGRVRAATAGCSTRHDRP